MFDARVAQYVSAETALAPLGHDRDRHGCLILGRGIVCRRGDCAY